MFSPSARSCLLALAASAASLAAEETPTAPPAPAPWESSLSPHASGPARPASDRSFWNPLAENPAARKRIEAAHELLATPLDRFDSALYLEYYNSGNRDHYQQLRTRRWGRLRSLTLAECLEGRGSFLTDLAQTIDSLCDEPSWCLPAHDQDAWIFHGNKPYIDLAVAMSGYDLAMALHLLGEALPAPTRETALRNLRERLTHPILEMIAGGDPDFHHQRHWWTRANHNWNAVCTAGGVGAILLTEENPATRAAAIRWAGENMALFLSGFAKDGYCSEGINYWSFGFGHFAMLAEAVRQQTNGELDWLDDPRVRRIIEAARQLEIVPDAFPGYADAAMRSAPAPPLTDYLARRGLWLQKGSKNAAQRILAESRQLYEAILFAFPAPEKTLAAGDSPRPAPTPLPLRSWLEDGGVYVGRPHDPDGLAVSWKLGHNAEHHNHNDVGSTFAFHRGEALLCDPGAMTYTAATFGPDRYRFPIMNSYGHSVPVVDGHLQSPGAKARGSVVKQTFQDSRDRMEADLTTCYPSVPDLKKLTRIWEFERQNRGALLLIDRFDAARPISFESALIANGTWRKTPDGRLIVTGRNGASLAITVTASHPVDFEIVRIENPGHHEVHRLAVRLLEARENGWIRLRATPCREDEIPTTDPLPATRTAPALLPDPTHAGF